MSDDDPIDKDTAEVEHAPTVPVERNGHHARPSPTDLFGIEQGSTGGASLIEVLKAFITPFFSQGASEEEKLRVAYHADVARAGPKDERQAMAEVRVQAMQAVRDSGRFDALALLETKRWLLAAVGNKPLDRLGNILMHVPITRDRSMEGRADDLGRAIAPPQEGGH